MLSLKLGMDGTTSGWIVEEFTAQMRVVSKIALHRRSNLASFLEMNGNFFFGLLITLCISIQCRTPLDMV